MYDHGLVGGPVACRKADFGDAVVENGGTKVVSLDAGICSDGVAVLVQDEVIVRETSDLEGFEQEMSCCVHDLLYCWMFRIVILTCSTENERRCLLGACVLVNAQEAPSVGASRTLGHGRTSCLNPPCGIAAKSHACRAECGPESIVVCPRWRGRNCTTGYHTETWHLRSHLSAQRTLAGRGSVRNTRRNQGPDIYRGSPAGSCRSCARWRPPSR